MANNKKNEAITARDVDFAKWYTDVCRKAELMDYSGVRRKIFRLSWFRQRRMISTKSADSVLVRMII